MGWKQTWKRRYIELYDIFVVCVYPSLSYTDESIFFLSWCHGKSFFPLIFFCSSERRAVSPTDYLFAFYIESTLYMIYIVLFRAALSPITLPNIKILYSTNNNVPSSFVCVCVWMWVSGFPFFNFLNNCEMIINTGKKRWQSFFNEITTCTWLIIISLVYTQLFFFRGLNDYIHTNRLPRSWW